MTDRYSAEFYTPKLVLMAGGPGKCSSGSCPAGLVMVSHGQPYAVRLVAKRAGDLFNIGTMSEGLFVDTARQMHAMGVRGAAWEQRSGFGGRIYPGTRDNVFVTGKVLPSHDHPEVGFDEATFTVDIAAIGDGLRALAGMDKSAVRGLELSL